MAGSSSTSSSGPGHNPSLNNVALGSVGSTSFVLTPASQSSGLTSNGPNIQSSNNLTVPVTNAAEPVSMPASMGLTSFVVTPASQSTGLISNGLNTQSRNNLTVPSINTTEPISMPISTPVLKAQTGDQEIPPLNLDNGQKDSAPTTLAAAIKQNNSGPSSSRRVLPASNLITQSPYAANEGLTITPGTLLWQASASTGSAQAVSAGLWTSATTRQSSGGASPRQVLPTSNLITQSPYEANENVKFSGEPARVTVFTNKRLEALKGSSTQQPTCLPGHVAAPFSNGITSTPYSLWAPRK